MNKLNTKVEIRFHVASADWMPEELRKSFAELHSNKMNKEGYFILTSTKERTQSMNIRDCFERLEELIEQANVKPKARIATEVPQGEREKRILEKKRESNIKKNRKVSRDD